MSFGCPLLQDYSLLNLLAAFSIILSYVSLPSCAFTSTLGEGWSETETDRQTESERKREKRRKKERRKRENGHLRIRD